jgi:hypothetical protein
METGRRLAAHLARLVHLRTHRGQLSSLLALICRYSFGTWFTLKGSDEIYSGHIRKDSYFHVGTLVRVEIYCGNIRKLLNLLGTHLDLNLLWTYSWRFIRFTGALGTNQSSYHWVPANSLSMDNTSLTTYLKPVSKFRIRRALSPW